MEKLKIGEIICNVTAFKMRAVIICEFRTDNGRCLYDGKCMIKRKLTAVDALEMPDLVEGERDDDQETDQR